MLAGQPVIYALEAPGDVVAESNSGISCPAEDHLALSQAIQKMYSMSHEEREVMGKRGRELGIKNRDYRILASEFLEAVM